MILQLHYLKMPLYNNKKYFMYLKKIKDKNSTFCKIKFFVALSLIRKVNLLIVYAIIVFTFFYKLLYIILNKKIKCNQL